MLKKFHNYKFKINETSSFDAIKEYHKIKVCGKKLDDEAYLFSINGGGNYSLYLQDRFFNLSIENETKNISAFEGDLNINFIKFIKIQFPNNIINAILSLDTQDDLQQGCGGYIHFDTSKIFYDEEQKRIRVFDESEGELNISQTDDGYNYITKYSIRTCWLAGILKYDYLDYNLVCNHINEIKSDDNPKNIEYISQSQNVSYGVSRLKAVLNGIGKRCILIDALYDSPLFFPSKEALATHMGITRHQLDKNDYDHIRFELIYMDKQKKLNLNEDNELKPIPGFDGYFYSFKYDVVADKNGNIRKMKKTSSGAYTTNINKENVFLHRLKWAAYHKIDIRGKGQVRFENPKNKDDLSMSNLKFIPRIK